MRIKRFNYLFTYAETTTLIPLLCSECSGCQVIRLLGDDDDDDEEEVMMLCRSE